MERPVFLRENMTQPDIANDARAWLAERGGRERTHTEHCHHWHADCLVARMADEIERLRAWNDEAQTEASIASLLAERRRLTDAERHCLREAVARMADVDDVPSHEIAAVLHGLLERFSG